MGISGSKKKLRKSIGRPEGWYKATEARWEERTSQNTGAEYIVYVFDGEKPDGESEEVQLFLGKTDKVGEYVKVDDGTLVSVDDDEEYEIPENSGVGRFFGSLSDCGVSDKDMDQIGDKPGVLNGKYLHIVQEEVLDKDGEPKKNDAGYAITNTIVDKLGTAKDFGGKATSKTSSKKKVEDDEEEEEEEEIPKPRRGKKVVEEEDEDDDTDDDDDDEDDEPITPRRRVAGKKR